MPEKSEGSIRLRLPPPSNGVNINFCKNPLCSNFGQEAELEDQRRRTRGNQGSLYRVTGVSIFCSVCQTHTSIKSNLAVSEEYERNLQLLATPGGLHCPKASCTNYYRTVDSHREHYYAHGLTAKGQPRYRCKACKATFSNAPRHLRQTTSHENKTVFQMLIGKVSLSKIAEITGLAPKTVYDKIDFLHAQCTKFLADRERRFPEISFRHLRIATDMQDYMVNWPTKAMRKTIQFRAIASSCLDSGYVFGCHPQIDTRFDTNTIQEAVDACGDLDLSPPFRRYARLWNYEDYGNALQLTPEAFKPAREDQDGPEHMTVDRQLPKQGSMIHIDYLMFGHFMYLHALLGKKTGSVHFSLDADPGLANACLSAWKDKCIDGKVDVAILRCNKSATIDEKNAAILEAIRLKNLAEELYPNLHPFEAHLSYFVTNSILVALDPKHRGEWLRSHDVEYPFIKKSEPGKTVRLLTDKGGRSNKQIAMIMHYTSLHQVDRFFMQIRRAIAGLERAPAYPRRASRKWYLYGFYSPEMVEKCLTIFRTYFNFIATGKDKKTPAMRLGLAKGPVRYEDIIYFQ
ncbi:IS1 family transposase [Agrobacterium rhizogenes]|nr:IS1 family transposase [Rhizobium rhizogenes]NTH43000.1 IS1 family transposase [Rhizobium rhizogenes]NTJ00541.1 IS1 family transposase [Rhizobium rhizogenes]